MISNENSACFSEIICNKSPCCVEFFHQKAAGPTLLAYTWEHYVTICVLHLPQLEPDTAEYNYENLIDIDHGPSVVKMSWSPNTSMLVHPIGLIFCTIGTDFQLRMFTLNNKMEVDIKIIGDHKSFINDCAFEPTTGREVASVGDDKKCRIWDTDTSVVVMVIPLQSAGKSVKWNINDPQRLLIGEQNGSIRLYETSTYQPIMSLNSLHVTGDLMSCDWSLLNTMKVGAVIGKHWVVWDTSKGSLPESSGPAHLGYCQDFRWSNVHEGFFGTRGRPDQQFHLYNASNEQMSISATTKVGRGLSWHNLLPICAIGGNRKILLYHLETFH